MRGLMMGIAGAGASVGMMAVVRAAAARPRDDRLAETYLVMAAVAALGMAPIGFAFYREAPERYGLLPDGRRRAALAAGDSASAQHLEGAEEDPSSAPAPAATVVREPEPEWTRAEALRTASFWAMSLGSLSIALTGTAFWFHLTAIIADRAGGAADEPPGALPRGGNRTTSGAACAAAASPPAIMGSVYTVLAVTSTVARILSGWLVDRLAPRVVLAASLALQALALWMVPLVRSTAAVLAVCVVQGVSQAVFSSVGQTVYAHFFGRRHLGSISGVGKSLVVLGSALGPFPFGAVRDLTGAFDLAFHASALLSLLCMLVALRYGRAPVKRAAARASTTVELPTARDSSRS